MFFFIEDLSGATETVGGFFFISGFDSAFIQSK